MAAAPDNQTLLWSKPAQLALAAFFALAIALPPLDTAFHFAPEVPLTENRKMREIPTLEWRKGKRWKTNLWRALAAYPARFDAAFSDRFGFRAWLVRLDAWVKVFAFHTSPVKLVVIGKDGWLYYGPGLCAAPQPPAAIDLWRKEIAAKAAWCRTHGITYLFVLTPVKETVYPEFLPDGLLPKKPSAADSLLTALQAMPDVSVLDLREALVRARQTSSDPVFYKTDTHWTDRGALAGAREIIERLRPAMPELRAPGASDFIWTQEILKRNGLAVGLGFSTQLPEAVEMASLKNCVSKKPEAAWFAAFPWTPDKIPEVFDCPASGNRRRLVLCSDSFGRALAPLLAHCFARTAYVRNHFPLGAPFRQAQRQVLTEEKADVFVDLISEQHLATPVSQVFAEAGHGATAAEPDSPESSLIAP